MSGLGKRSWQVLCGAAVAAVLNFGTWTVDTAGAGLILNNSPPSTATAGLPQARLRWGGSGYEAAIRLDGIDRVMMFPTGTPRWSDGEGRNFLITYQAATGAFNLSVDWDRNNSFSGIGESISWSITTPDRRFSGIRFFNNSQNISITPLTVQTNLGNSTLASVPFNGTSYYTWTNLSSIMSDLTLAGQIRFDPTGVYSNESRWEVGLVGASAVPEPGSMSLLAAGMAGLVGFRRLRKRRS